ncbi:TetR/AcrR family transcriptional regulator [Streptomyces acidiscabies]|uniref:TetR/AcrR family transcriptional regulator n=1 Tax=Streptomyces acidiscabies TaxID=42234 RepID=UPI00076E9211|nr:TetR/AcrR family transcriptional regulator [Streptomyces acidiscabies]GAQ51917.1 DNA-binding transcriptional repressor AcrR [Streptomyces acidiscabies]
MYSRSADEPPDPPEDALNTTPTVPAEPYAPPRPAGVGRPGGRAAKRRAITEGARTVFGRDGYSRTSIEAIATEAGVSTRTIYNHFQGKDHLFSDVLHDSASQVADAFVATVSEHLAGADARADLLVLGNALVGQRTQFPEHFAMIRQIRAEEQHFPPAVIDTWRQAGPLRVQQEVTHRLDDLARAGLLDTDDPSRATAHFVALVNSEISPHGDPQTPAQIHACVTRAVDAFLHGYGGN